VETTPDIIAGLEEEEESCEVGVIEALGFFLS